MYGHGHHESVLRSHRWRTAANSAAHLLPHLRPHQSLLDVGCGPGTITADLAALVGHVTALETSEEVLRLARHEISSPNVSFAVGDVHSLPFADNTFDVVNAHQVLQHVADPVQALRQMRRVCRPGGIVSVRDSDYAGFIWYPTMPELNEWLDLYRAMARLAGGEPDAGRRLLHWAQQAGFSDISAGSSTWCYSTEQERDFWGGMWAQRVTSSSIAAQALASGYATQADLHRLSAAWLAWAADPGAWFSVVHGELICISH
jgi:ubiquinone/menaquinone biosynthesis C-methylase UbiE